MSNPKISITALIYKSPKFADWLYESLYKYTPLLQTGEAEFYFIANDATISVLNHLKEKQYPFYINNNLFYTDQQLLEMGIGWPEYISRVYRGWNQAILKAKGERVLLLNSDNFMTPDWLENLLEYSEPNNVVCSQLVERHHPRHGIFPGAIHGEFGNTIDNFKEKEFLQFAEKIKQNKIKPGGAYMPCLLYKNKAIQAGLYPEGNLAIGHPHNIIGFGDEVFFQKLAKIGVKHYTVENSISYHLKEGEMEE